MVEWKHMAEHDCESNIITLLSSLNIMTITSVQHINQMLSSFSSICHIKSFWFVVCKDKSKVSEKQTCYQTWTNLNTNTKHVLHPEIIDLGFLPSLKPFFCCLLFLSAKKKKTFFSLQKNSRNFLYFICNPSLFSSLSQKQFSL